MTAYGRTPPSDELTERALLGHILSHGRVPEGVNGLAPSHFWLTEHEMLYASMVVIPDHCDVPSVLTHLEKRGLLTRGTLKARGGVGDLYVAELLAAPSVTDPAHAAKTIQDLARRREVIKIHQRGLQRAEDLATDLHELLRRTEKDLDRVQESSRDHDEDIRLLLPRIDWHELSGPTTARRSGSSTHSSRPAEASPCSAPPNSESHC